MNDHDKLIADRAISLRAATNIFIEPVVEAIYQDPHQWSTRPCGTCRTITSIIGKPFGCDRYRKERGGG